jgi:prepilin-type N-terminal cleavage/methylation domain-containing protein
MNGMLLVRAGERTGFSLLEVVVVLSIVALAAAVAMPAVGSLRRGRDTRSAAHEMYLCLKMARWKAIVSGCRTRLATFARQGDSAVWYVIERQEGTVWIPEGEGHRVPDGVRIRMTGPVSKQFTPEGTCTMGSIIFEGASGGCYRLSMNPATGRVRFYRGDEEVGRDG